MPGWAACLQKRDAKLIVELEKKPADDWPSGHSHLPLLQGLFSRDDEQGVMDEFARGADALLALDRVMVYRFEPDGSGIVTSEVNHSQQQEYLGLRFPAGDIPPNARRIYLQNKYRFVFDVDGGTVPVWSAPGQPFPPNLTHSLLRAVAPVHLQYLRNMGVRAALSIPIVIEEELWGLLSCHHSKPLNIGYRQREEIGKLSEVFHQKLRQIRINERMRFVDRRARRYRNLVRELRTGLQDHQIHLIWDCLWEVAEAGGLAVYRDEEWITAGNCPMDDSLEMIRTAIPKNSRVGVFSTDCLSSLNFEFESDAEVASGIMCLWVSGSSRRTIEVYWFRPELVQEVHWGGVPPEEGPGQKMGPRSSFASWRQEMRNHSAPWEREAQLGAQTFLTEWLRSYD